MIREEIVAGRCAAARHRPGRLCGANAAPLPQSRRSATGCRRSPGTVRRSCPTGCSTRSPRPAPPAGRSIGWRSPSPAGCASSSAGARRRRDRRSARRTLADDRARERSDEALLDGLLGLAAGFSRRAGGGRRRSGPRLRGGLAALEGRRSMPDIDAILAAAPVIPVLVIERLEDAVPIAEALVAGGLPVLEVTLRTPAALDAIRAMKRGRRRDRRRRHGARSRAMLERRREAGAAVHRQPRPDRAARRGARPTRPAPSCPAWRPRATSCARSTTAYAAQILSGDGDGRAAGAQGAERRVRRDAVSARPAGSRRKRAPAWLACRRSPASAAAGWCPRARRSIGKRSTRAPAPPPAFDAPDNRRGRRKRNC